MGWRECVLRLQCVCVCVCERESEEVSGLWGYNHSSTLIAGHERCVFGVKWDVLLLLLVKDWVCTCLPHAVVTLKKSSLCKVEKSCSSSLRQLILCEFICMFSISFDIPVLGLVTIRVLVKLLVKWHITFKFKKGQ